MRHPALCGAVAQFLGPSFRHNNAKLNFKPASAGSAVEWHQDWGFYPHTNGSVLAVGVFLDDIDSENGPTMVVPASHKGPIWDHHTDFGERGHLFVGGIESTNVDTSAAVQICGPAGSVSVHHVREVHGSDHNRSACDRRILFIECVGADAWPLLGCPELQSDASDGAAPWYHHAPAEFDAATCALRSPTDPTLCLPLTMPATDDRGTPMMGRGVSDAPRMEPAPVRMPMPRADAPAGPGGGIYATQSLLQSKSFPGGGSRPRL